jgi:hypothetical protein
VPYATALATQNAASAEQRAWRVNLITNYTFTRDSFWGEKLKGFSLGTGVRWQDRVILGYPSTRNSNGSVNVDIAHPYFGPTQTDINAWIGYERKLSHGITWKIQLNGNNIFSSGDLIGTNVQSYNGEIATYRLPPERRWYLTNTFTF